MFSPDGEQLALGSYDHTIKIWGLSASVEGILRRTLEGHTRWVRSVVFSPDGKKLASASEDMTIKFWNIGAAVGFVQRTYEAQGKIDWISFHPSLPLLFTSIGQIELDYHYVSEPSSTTVEPKGLCIVTNWILKDKERILWLPPKYRSSACRSMGHVLALGCASGRVMFYEFSFGEVESLESSSGVDISEIDEPCLAIR